MSAAKLDQAIKAVCPIYGVSIGKSDDKATWSIQFKPEATQSQIDAAMAVLNSHEFSELPEKSKTETRLENIEKALQLSSISIPTMTE